MGFHGAYPDQYRRGDVVSISSLELRPDLSLSQDEGIKSMLRWNFCQDS